MRILLIYIITNIGLANSCVRTADVGVTTVPATAIPVTTAPMTSVVDTTTTGDCMSCNLDQLLYIEDPNPDPSAPNHPPVKTYGPSTDEGCSTLHLSCTPINNNPLSLITFVSSEGADIGQAGQEGQGNPGMATLACRTDGQWEYVPEGRLIGGARCEG